MMKTTALLAALILLLGAATADHHTVEVFVHGEQLVTEPAARLHEGVAYAPLRAISEAVGAEVTWLAHRQTAVVCEGDRCVDITRDEALVVDGAMLVPVRLLAEALEKTVDWHENTRQISVREKDSAVGMKAIPLSLAGVDGPYELSGYGEKVATCIVFWSNHCPTIIAYQERFIALVEQYKPKGIEFVAIGSNCPERYPADNFENMKIRAQEKGYNFAYVHDATQEVARSYRAERTPDVFLVGPEGFVVYRGRIESDQDPAKVTRHDLREALDEMLAGKPVSVKDTPPHGCTIKWAQ